MQTAERSTRSSQRFLAERTQPEPEGHKEVGPYQAFLHEKSHEDSARAAAGRVMATRSSKMADVVHVRPTRPGHLLNSVVKFRKDQKADQAFTPRECVTRRSHGSMPAAGHRRDGYQKSHFQLTISKLADATVHLIDPFGNSIEILTDVFDTYTLDERDEPSACADETSSRSSREVPAGELVEEGSAASDESATVVEDLVSPPVVSSEPSEIPAEVGGDLPLQQTESGSTTPEEESCAGGANAPEKAPAAARSTSEADLASGGSSAPEEESAPEKPCTPDAASPPLVSPEPVKSSFEVSNIPPDEAILQPRGVPEDAEAEMDTSPEAAEKDVSAALASPHELPNGMAPNKDPSVGRGFAPLSLSADSSETHVHEDDHMCPIEPPNSCDEARASISEVSAGAPAVHEQSDVPAEEIMNPDPTLRPHQTQMDRQTSISSGEPKLDPVVQQREGDNEASSAGISTPGQEEIPHDVCSKMLTSVKTTSSPRDEAREGPPADEGEVSKPESDEGKGSQLLEPQAPSAEENVQTQTSSQEADDASKSESKVRDLLQPAHGKEPEKSGGLLAGKPLLHNDETAIGDKRESDLFERDLFQLESQVGAPIVCDQGAHSAMMVQEQEDDNCLDGSNMKYISESEMIRLLEQDKDELSQVDEDHTSSKPSTDAGDMGAPTSPGKLAEKGSCVLKSDQRPQDKADTDFCLPANDEPKTGHAEARGPAESLVTKDVESITKSSAQDSSISEPSLPHGLCRRSLEALNVRSSEEVPLPQIKQTDRPKELTEQNNWADEPGQIPSNAGTVSAPIDGTQTEQSEKFKNARGSLSSQHENIEAHVPFTGPDQELQTTCSRDSSLAHEKTSVQETRRLETQPRPLSVPNLKQSTESGDQTRVSSERVNEQQEQLCASETQSLPCGEQPTTNLDLEPLGDVNPENLAELTTVLSEEAEAESFSTPTREASDLSSPSKDWSVCQDDVQGEDSELMEEEPEDNGANWKTQERPLGAGAECLKCGRRIRRSRKEMVWSPVCFKCRMVAKRKERLSNQSESSECPVEALFSRGEEGPTSKFSDQKLKLGGDGMPDISDITLHLDPATGAAAEKMYKCPKCDKAFKIPALLAGHIKCHTLPQCLTCGCQIPLKYKTKRIPRRCQRCIQQIREGKSISRESGGEHSGTSDNEELSLSLSDIPDVSSEDTGATAQKGKMKPLGKELDDEETEETSEKLEDSSDEVEVSVDGGKPRMCSQCGKTFKCNRSLNLHLLSHSTAQCESCGCRLQKKRRAGRWSKKCRFCKLQGKDQLPREGEDQAAPPGDKLSKRLQAKQAMVSQKKKMQSIIKQKKELKWKNMLLAVKKLMNKSKKRKEMAAQNADPEKKTKESPEAEKCEAAAVNDDGTSAVTVPPLAGAKETESSGTQSDPHKTPKQGRKCLYKEKNIIKVEEEEVLPCTPDDVPISLTFLKEEEIWQCLECNQSLENLEALLGHQQSHIDGQSFTCPKCPQVFSSEEYMKVHIPAHDKKRPYRCPECDQTFTKRNHLGVHLRVHSGLRPFACPDCPRKFRQKATLLAHRYSHRNFEHLLTKPHQCSVCNKSFKQKERLVVHERLHTGECPFACKDCDKVFPSRARLYVHRKLHKLEKASSSTEQQVICKEEEGPFHCQDCEKICSTKASFALHCKVHKLSSEPKEEVRPLYCKKCDKVFASKATLSMHLKNHSAHRADPESNPDPKQAYPCKDCDKVCSTKASLVLHRRVHQSSANEQNLDIKIEDQMPGFACKDCDKVCTTKASLVLHSKVHKSGKEQSPDDAGAPSFKCKKCSMVFSTKVSLVLHKKTHKPLFRVPKKLKDEAEPRSFRCKLCDTLFPTKASLVLHRKQHRLSANEENPKAEGESQSFSCKDCDKVCSTKASLVLHSKVHKLAGEENPEPDTEGRFVCKVCDKVCSTKASFVLHRKIHRSSSSERNQEETSHRCKECNRMFSSKGRLSFHLFKKHGMPPKSDQALDEDAAEDQPKKVSEDKLFSCTICGQRFTKLKMLVQHKAIHGDRTATPCTHCGKRFLYKKSLLNHMKICQGKAKAKKLLLLKKAKRKLTKEGHGSGTEDETAEKKVKTEEETAQKGKAEEETAQKRGKAEEETAQKGKAEEETAQKKGKPEDKKKAVTRKLKAKNQLEKTKKANKEKGGARTKEKRAKSESDAAAEDEGKKSAPEKPSDGKSEKSTDPAPKEQSGREKNTGKVKRVKKEPPKEKRGRSTKKMAEVVHATVKKKKLQAVVIGGKKKLLVKKKRVPLKPKAGAKSGQGAKEN